MLYKLNVDKSIRNYKILQKSIQKSKISRSSDTILSHYAVFNISLINFQIIS